MPSQRRNKVIIDTNLWISFLIGKELQILKDLIVTEKITLVTSDQLIEELKIVTSRPKLQKYFDREKVAELIFLLDIVSERFEIVSVDAICRDPKDDFILALSKVSRANYLVTGDKDLLDIKHYGRTEILTVSKFKERIK